MIVEILVDHHTSAKHLGNLACERNLIWTLYDPKCIGDLYIHSTVNFFEKCIIPYPNCKHESIKTCTEKKVGSWNP
jgi:hypothetical protein